MIDGILLVSLAVVATVEIWFVLAGRPAPLPARVARWIVILLIYLWMGFWTAVVAWTVAFLALTGIPIATSRLAQGPPKGSGDGA